MRGLSSLPQQLSQRLSQHRWFRALDGSRTVTVSAVGAGAVLVGLTGFSASAGTVTGPQEPAGAAAVEAAERGEPQASRSSDRDSAEPEAVVMPLAEGTYRSASGYGHRSDPISGARTMHTGTDMSAPMDTPIHAVADGVVDYVGPGKDGRSDMLIVLEHEIDGETVYSWYNHMYRDGLHVEAGEQVEAGDVIGAVGSNGRSTGPHLHLEIHVDDELTTVEPLAWLEEHDAVDVSEL